VFTFWCSGGYLTLYFALYFELYYSVSSEYSVSLQLSGIVYVLLSFVSVVFAAAISCV